MFFGLLSTSLISTPSYADDDDFVKGLMGVMIGAAIANSGNSTEANSNNQKKSKKPSISSAERADNKRVQENLNYFGFNTGNPDGIFGRKTTEAVYKFQGCLNRPMTGSLDNFEKQFLDQSTFQAQANGTQTLQFVAQSPNGYCGLLQKYFLDLTAPQPAVEPATTVVATTTTNNTELQVASSTTNVISVDNSVNVNIIAADVQAKFDKLSGELALLQQIEAHIKEKSDQ